MREAVQEAVMAQRAETVREHEEALAALKAEGCDVAELPPAGHEAFVKSVQPLYEEARRALGPELFKLRP